MSLLFNAKWVRLVLLSVLLSALTGCALWTGDDGRYNPTPLTEYKPGLSARIAWKAQIGKDLVDLAEQSVAKRKV